METNPIPNASFNIKGVFLLKSFFERINPSKDVSSIDFNTIKREINVNVENKVDGNFLYCIVTLTYNSIFPDGDKEIECTIAMLGSFEVIGEANPQSGEKFLMFNAPAIVFPYIREHLSGLSIKAGLPTILLPPFNFTNLKKN